MDARVSSTLVRHLRKALVDVRAPRAMLAGIRLERIKIIEGHRRGYDLLLAQHDRLRFEQPRFEVVQFIAAVLVEHENFNGNPSARLLLCFCGSRRTRATSQTAGSPPVTRAACRSAASMRSLLLGRHRLLEHTRPESALCQADGHRRPTRISRGPRPASRILKYMPSEMR
jgi:hypothetical protein